jgi:hypothetical protein
MRRMDRIFGPNRKKVMEGWKRLYYEELCSLYTSLNIVRMINKRRMRGTLSFHGYPT